jgi:outer membrane protein OmpA-like peptidoglycan-associated protein
MRNRLLTAAVALAAFVPTLALAQQRPAPQPAARPAAQPMARPAATGGTAEQAGAIELSIQPTMFIARDKALNAYLDFATNDDVGNFLPGASVRFGYQISPKLDLGGGIGFGTGSGVTLIQPHVGISYTLNPDARVSPLFTLGAYSSRWSMDAFGNRPDAANGVGGMAGLGFRYFAGEKLAVRVDARAGIQNYSGEDINSIEGSLAAGISYFMGGGPPRDTDGDGVPDSRDRCANTPRGATVDARGCPSDTDRDGVPNGIDRCPDTPPNTPVDATGCTRDSDRDGVADNLDRCPNTPAGTPVDATGCPRDSDGDGVHDGADRCPNTPRGTPVDANGCPLDSDGDGVVDSSDRCPNTPRGVPVDASGCPLDSDGDGVHDGADRCPNTARGTPVDASGCPLARDADGDGVVDERDRCPNTPAGTRVDSTGCPIAAELTRVGAALRLQNITFAAGSSRLAATSNASLNDMARQIRGVLERESGARFEVGGHTDNTGAALTNRRLSQARAQAVVTYLVAQGVPAAALTAVGYGPDQPAAPNTTAPGRAQNRRVEIKRTS